MRIRNLRKELDSSENIIMTLNNALSNKDPRSGGHVQRMAAYAARLCDKLGMSLSFSYQRRRSEFRADPR